MLLSLSMLADAGDEALAFIKHFDTYEVDSATLNREGGHFGTASPHSFAKKLCST